MRVFADGRDPFLMIAAEWNSVEVSNVTSEQRKEMKKVTYSVLYGVGSAALAVELTIEVSQAQDFINEFRSRYPAIVKYQERVIKQTLEQGYVKTISGRRRFLPLIHSKSITQRLHAERQALSIPLIS
jgi:DNA polymerase I-like protein with 3'-5' exonuclease and polymerase domains